MHRRLVNVNTVHLCAGDDIGWALDEDLRLLREALRGICKPAPLRSAQVAHAVWWLRLLPLSRQELQGKHVLCYADNAPFHYATEPDFLRARERVTLWIARSREASAQFTALGLESRFAPYTIDPAIFHPLPAEDARIRALSQKWHIPTDRYLIANFHRDTESSDLQSPKLQKGPDAFLEIVSRLHEEGAPVHVLLAGPRRFFLRRALAERGVPFTFLGQETGGRDDIGVNVLPRATLNLLYNIADLHLISSRWEGGPHSVLESAATRCKVISTPVGIAPDVLAPECLFSDIHEACEIVRRDIRENIFAASTETHFARVLENHSEGALRRSLVEIYESLPPVCAPPAGFMRMLDVSFRRVARSVSGRFQTPPKPLRIAILHRPSLPEAQTLEFRIGHLATELRRKGHTVFSNQIDPELDGVLIGTLPKDDPLYSAMNELPVIPVIGFINEVSASDEGAFSELMSRHGERDTCTVLPSHDALDALRKRGLLPHRVLVLLPIAEILSDADCTTGADSGSPLERTARSAVPQVGETKTGAEPSEPLVVAEGDAWAADRIVSALASGRPILYPASSHYRWLVWFGGAAYAGPDDARQKLDSIRANWSMFARMTSTTTSPQVADRIVSLLRVCRDLIADED